MLETLIFVLGILCLQGLVTSCTRGGFIRVLLVLAHRVIRGRRLA